MIREAAVVVLLIAGVLSLQGHWPHKIADKEFLKHQINIFELFYHVHQPTVNENIHNIANTWDLEKNIDHFHNTTAVNLFLKVLSHGFLPRDEIFSVLHDHHRFEAETIFNVLYNAKDWETFFNFACWLREHINPHMFVYTLSVAIIHRHDTHGMILPPIYEIFPHYFLNGEIMSLAKDASKYGKDIVNMHNNMHLWDHNIVIDANVTYWPYWTNEEYNIGYFTNDIDWNSFYYYYHLDYPFWMGEDVNTLVKDRRGELWWYTHQQLLARYYMERLSNGLGEIDHICWIDPVATGYTSGLVYENGVRFPERDNHINVMNSETMPWIIKVEDAERRIRDAIDHGYFETETGEHISLKEPEAIDMLGRLIDANDDSPNKRFYTDIVGIWRKLVGHSTHQNIDWHTIIPSVLEHYTTAMRDPAFYQIWKRILYIFKTFQEHLPLYTHEQLHLPGVVIKDVEIDKLTTYFDNYHVNVTNGLWLDNHEIADKMAHHSVVVRQTRLNHKMFKVRVHVKSEVAKTVVVKFFLAPKYDSRGHIIPLVENRMNFIELDMFKFDLKQGENIIVRGSDEFSFMREDFTSSHELYWKMLDAFKGNGQFPLDMSEAHSHFPNRLLLPRGTRGGMPYVFLAYVHEYRAPKVEFGTGFDWTITSGLGTGARFLTDTPFGFPLERPIYEWQVEDVDNFYMEDVMIYHKAIPELNIHYTD